jgi:hypothetical protein
MKFVNIEGLEKGKITSEVVVAGIPLDLHNDWNLIVYSLDLRSKSFGMQWQSESHLDVTCWFEFTGVKWARIEPRDPEYPAEEGQTVTDVLYQDRESGTQTVKFWFQDESTIEVAADQLALVFVPRVRST